MATVAQKINPHLDSVILWHWPTQCKRLYMKTCTSSSDHRRMSFNVLICRERGTPSHSCLKLSWKKRQGRHRLTDCKDSLQLRKQARKASCLAGLLPKILTAKTRCSLFPDPELLQALTNLIQVMTASGVDLPSLLPKTLLIRDFLFYPPTHPGSEGAGFSPLPAWHYISSRTDWSLVAFGCTQLKV